MLPSRDCARTSVSALERHACRSITSAVGSANDDPATITTFEDPALKAKLAGTTTIGEGRLSDSMFGYQLLAGADYAATDDASFVLKVRRVALADFTSDGHVTFVARHAPTDG